MTMFSTSRIKRCRAFLVALATLMVPSALFPASSTACEMTVVVSAEIRPYREVLQGLREAGVCGVHEVKLHDGDPLERIRRTRPDAVVAIGTDAFRKVRSLRDVPLVHVMVIPSEAGHGRGVNRAGVSMDIAPAAWLSAIRQLFPEATRAGLLYDPDSTGEFVTEALRAAPETGLGLNVRMVRKPDDVPRALQAMQNAVDVLWMLPDPAVAAPPTVEYLIRFSIQHRIPIVTFSRKYLEMGAVASLDVDPRDMGAQAAELVRRIVNEGASPGSEYARKTRLTVNRSAAEKMGIVIGKAPPPGRDE